MKKSKGISTITDAFKDLELKKEAYLKHRYTKYVVDYKFDGDNIRVFSNIGNYRTVKNTRSNLSKINRAIVKNKIDIAHKIDDYENTSKERALMLLFNLLMVSVCGGIVVLSFFSGVYLFFLLSLVLFLLISAAAFIMSLNTYVKVSEIQELKRITGYKKSNEFQLPKINVKFLKNRN